MVGNDASTATTMPGTAQTTSSMARNSNQVIFATGARSVKRDLMVLCETRPSTFDTDAQNLQLERFRRDQYPGCCKNHGEKDPMEGRSPESLMQKTHRMFFSIIRKAGNLATYDQAARTSTEFGTIESLTCDVAGGSYRGGLAARWD